MIAAVWIYRDAVKCGYSKDAALLWSAGAVILVYVFLPLYILLGRKRRPASQNEAKEMVIDAEFKLSEEIEVCPNCAERVREEFVACPYCGYVLRPVCKSCGRDLERDWKACPYCGASALER